MLPFPLECAVFLFSGTGLEPLGGAAERLPAATMAGSSTGFRLAKPVFWRQRFSKQTRFQNLGLFLSEPLYKRGFVI